ncbi:MAG: Gfo/Idh/MocA family oxidoreductase [Clostridiaceae bacterium]|jgi:predicted dehydrogenase|nr:Gfo/Idh/MocA family oxidoreductase [Clostridiaceae bacterium]
MSDISDKSVVRWAVCGLGSISHAFMRAASKVENARVTACVSSSKERAEAFKQRYGLEAAYTYDEFLTSNGADAVYVCTNMNDHVKNTVAFLKAGFPVLCEKAFALTVAEAEEMFAAARTADKLVMEAMWTRFIPCTEKLLEVIHAGEIGKITSMTGAMIGIFTNKKHRVFDKARGGGTMLDLMVYNAAYSHFLKGAPESVSAKGVVQNGVDTDCTITLTYADGTKALLRSSSTAKPLKFGFVIEGENGKIKIPHFHWGTGFKVFKNGRLLPKHYRFPFPDFTYEIKHFNALLLAGATESPLMSEAVTVAVMGVLEEANRQLGVEF